MSIDIFECSENPLFSIITPTFKRPEFLARNIRSVINQTYNTFEHIIIDDANDSTTEKLIDSFGDERIKLVKHEKSKGAAASYNSGLRKSCGKFVLFLDDDDEYMPFFLEKMHKCFISEDMELGFVWSGISKIEDTDDGEIALYSRVWPGDFSKKENGIIAATSIGNGFGLCVRRECFGKIGFYDESLKIGEDTDLLFRLTMNFKFKTIPDVLVKIHQHKFNQLTGEENYLDKIRGMEIILERYRDFLKQYPKVFAVHYSAYARLCYRYKLNKNGRAAIAEIVLNQPANIKTYFNFISYELTGKSISDTFFGKTINLLFKRRIN
ncbi:MAG TPA: glycosyltransferase [Bacteroidales bacterium]|nr:glycosyltransferase [Bacteroidales bacterium]